MEIIIKGNSSAITELRGDIVGVNFIEINHLSEFENYKSADAFINLDSNAYEVDYPKQTRLLIINSVIHPATIPDVKSVLRINGWPGFLRRSTWELCGEIDEHAAKVLGALGKTPIVMPNEPGLVSGRILAMIINEAYFAKGENISTEAEIDIAMKLGTNYPKGPFEWAAEIGLKNIYALLLKLSKKDRRYSPSALLEKEST